MKMKIIKNTKIKNASIIFILSCFLISPLYAEARTLSWQGTQDNVFSRSANWSGIAGGGGPASTDDIVFPAGSARQPILTNSFSLGLGRSTTFDTWGVDFTANPTNRTYTVGSGITISDGNSVNENEIMLGIIWRANQVINASSTHVASPTDIAAAYPKLILHGNITGTGPIRKKGAGRLVIDDQNGTAKTYTVGLAFDNDGGLTIPGTITLNSPTAVGFPYNYFTTVSGAKVDTTNNTTMTWPYHQIWNGSFEFLGSSSLDFGVASTTLGADVTATIDNNTYDAGSGGLDGDFTLTKAGSGTLTIDGPVSVGGLVRGTGGFNLPADITVTNYGTSGAFTSNVTYRNSSINHGAITGNAVFVNNASENAGTVSGSVTRQFITSVKPDRNFTDNSWDVVADGTGVQVNLADSTWNQTTFFMTQNDGIFVNGPARYWFSDGANPSWTNLSNWWTDADHTSQAGFLPKADDPIVTLGTVTPEVDLDNILYVNPYSIDATQTGITFTSAIGEAPLVNIQGDVTFNNFSYHESGITITGNAFFNDVSYNAGAITGTSTFNYATGHIITIPNGGKWGNGTATTVVGADNDSITNWIFLGNSVNFGTVSSTTFMGDLSQNSGTITGHRTRHYTSYTAPTRSFVTDQPWTVIADTAEVDLNGATFNPSTTFLTANNGFYTTILTNCTVDISGGNLDYELTGNVTRDCTISNDNIDFNGAGHVVTGNILGSGSGNGANGHSFNLTNIKVNQVFANGASGTSNGGSGGTITISLSTTTSVDANGGNGAIDGGGGGYITMATTTSTTIAANGGNSTGCGYGGSGGDIFVYDAVYTSAVAHVGTNGAASCGVPGSTGSVTTFTTPPPTTGGGGSGGGSGDGGGGGGGGSSGSIVSIAQLKALNLPTLPSFNIVGNNQLSAGVTNLGNLLEGVKAPEQLSLSFKAFSLLEPISAFLSAPLPGPVQDILKKSDKLGGFLASAGFSRQQNLAALSVNPILLPMPEVDPPGLYIVARSGARINTYLSSDKEHPLFQMVKVPPGTELSVSFVPLEAGVVTGTFAGKTVHFTQGQARVSAAIVASTTPGRYFLTTPASPLTLGIEVTAPLQPVKIPSKNRFWDWLKKFF